MNTYEARYELRWWRREVERLERGLAQLHGLHACAVADPESVYGTAEFYAERIADYERQLVVALGKVAVWRRHAGRPCPWAVSLSHRRPRYVPRLLRGQGRRCSVRRRARRLALARQDDDPELAAPSGDAA